MVHLWAFFGVGAATDLTYSPQRRWLTRIVTTRPNGQKLIDNTYTRDNLGRITAIAGLTPADSWTYAYDGFDRLKTATNAGDPSLSETYTYSPSGNLKTRSRLTNAGQGSFTYPAGTATRPHAPLTLGSRVLTHDANGNMTADGQRVFTLECHLPRSLRRN